MFSSSSAGLFRRMAKAEETMVVAMEAAKATGGTGTEEPVETSVWFCREDAPVRHGLNSMADARIAAPKTREELDVLVRLADVAARQQAGRGDAATGSGSSAVHRAEGGATSAVSRLPPTRLGTRRRGAGDSAHDPG
jgi:hypothetical protein